MKNTKYYAVSTTNARMLGYHIVESGDTRQECTDNAESKIFKNQNYQDLVNQTLFKNLIIINSKTDLIRFLGKDYELKIMGFDSDKADEKYFEEEMEKTLEEINQTIESASKEYSAEDWAWSQAVDDDDEKIEETDEEEKDTETMDF